MKNSEEQQLTQLFKVLNQAEAPVQTSWEVLSGKMEKSFWKFKWFHWNVFYLVFSATIAVGAVLFMAYQTSLPSPQVKKQKMDTSSNQTINKEETPEPLRKHPDNIAVPSENPLIIPDSNKVVITKTSSKTKENSQSDYTKKSDTIIATEAPVTRIPDSTVNHIKPPVPKVEKEPAGKKIIIFAEDTVVTVTDTIRTNRKPKKIRDKK